MRKNSFIQGALILTVAGIIVKFIGAFSRIYLSRLLGGEGIGLYQMAYPIYMLCLSISSAGLPVAISIMVAERNAVNDYWGGQKVFRISMTALTLTGIVFSALLYFGADWLVHSGVVTDERAYWSLIALSPAVMTKSWRRELASQQDSHIKPLGVGTILKRLLILAVPVSLANIMLPVVSSIDLFIVPRRLAVAGFSVEEATTLFGYLTGMATALVNMPTIVTASLAASLVPVISEAVAQNKSETILKRTHTAMRLANLITIPSFVGQVTTGVLQGMGKTAIPFINMVVSAAVKVFLSWNLTALPSWGVLGAAWATNADFGVAALLNLFFLYKYRRYMMDIMHTVKLFIAAGIMGAVAYGVYTGLYGIIHSNTLSTLAAIGASGIVYCIAVVMLRAVKGEDVASIPKIGGKMAALIDRCSIVKK